jgi:hypothetical protein
MADFGLSFLPYANGQDQNGGPPIEPTQQAIKVLNLRLPRVLGGSAPAPRELLQGAGNFGNPLGRSALIQNAFSFTPSPVPGQMRDPIAEAMRILAGLSQPARQSSFSPQGMPLNMSGRSSPSPFTRRESYYQPLPSATSVPPAKVIYNVQAPPDDAGSYTPPDEPMPIPPPSDDSLVAETNPWDRRPQALRQKQEWLNQRGDFIA